MLVVGCLGLRLVLWCGKPLCTFWGYKPHSPQKFCGPKSWASCCHIFGLRVGKVVSPASVLACIRAWVLASKNKTFPLNDSPAAEEELVAITRRRELRSKTFPLNESPASVEELVVC